MNQIEYFEKIYISWDGTPDHASELMRYLYLANKTIFNGTTVTDASKIEQVMEPLNKDEDGKI